ncbi:hypothetical protein Tco_0318957 [Tanacetum coccineum]
MHNYYLDRGHARCAFKVDIKKAYDKVDWNFLNDILIGFGFHPRSSGTSLLPSGRGMIHNELSNFAKVDSSKRESSGGVVDLTGDEDPTDEDGNIGIGDPTGVSMYLGGEIFSGRIVGN